MSGNHQLNRYASEGRPVRQPAALGPVYKGHESWQRDTCPLFSHTLYSERWGKETAEPGTLTVPQLVLGAQASCHPAGGERLTTAPTTCLPPLNQPVLGSSVLVMKSSELSLLTLPRKCPSGAGSPATQRLHPLFLEQSKPVFFSCSRLFWVKF